VAYVFESEEEVLEMAKAETWQQVKRVLECEDNFMWLENEMVSSPLFRIVDFLAPFSLLIRF